VHSIAVVNARQPIQHPAQKWTIPSPVVIEQIPREQRRVVIYSVFYSCNGGMDKEFWAENGVIVGMVSRTLGVDASKRYAV
jgi:hypothetical protein